MFRWLIAGTLLAVTASAADVDDGPVTYNRDVLPIFEKNCLGCHRPGQIAPMSFLTYETTRPWVDGGAAEGTAQPARKKPAR